MHCGRPLSAAEESRGAQSCADGDCRMYARLNKGHAEAKRCPVCRVPLSPDRLAAGVCLDLDCQSVEGRRRGAELAEQRAQQFAEQTRLGTLLRGELAGAAEIADDRTASGVPQ